MDIWDFFLNEFVVEEIMHSYGWYHFMWIGIMIALCVVCCVLFAKKHNKKTDDIFVFTCGMIFFIIEAFKQALLVAESGFNFWYFPYQFCSVPMFIAIIGPLVKKENIKEAMYKFLAIAGLAAGISVMVYPETCLDTPYIALLIHTMLWHSLMVVMGVYLIVSREYMKDIKKFKEEIVPAGIILYVLIAIALAANFICQAIGVDVNFFWISPYFETTFPLLNTVQANAPYIVFLILYLISFTAVICLVWFAAYGIRKLCTKKTQ